jgi:hypothetical protein
LIIPGMKPGICINSALTAATGRRYYQIRNPSIAGLTL